MQERAPKKVGRGVRLWLKNQMGEKTLHRFLLFLYVMGNSRHFEENGNEKRGTGDLWVSFVDSSPNSVTV